ncbi:MAG: terpene cyclase/mutase family protein [Planctomycetes bacterium]|nr:terpene cyclase/mutase family protein [Planctomycetota bacterium]
MDTDFGTLVDYLRGELPKPAMAEVRQRLESDAGFFERFQSLRRTFAVLRSLPAVGAASAGPSAAQLPSMAQLEPRAAFVADLHREFEARGWAGLLPALLVAPQFVAALRVEFAVRTLINCLPGLVPGAAWLQSLRTEFGLRGVIDRLPALAVRAQWVRLLRQEFALRATVATLPEIAVRPEYAAALRAEFAQRALVASVGELSVSDRLRRRLQVSLFEAQREQAPAAQAPATAATSPAALPAMSAGDSFRRRLFKKILLSSRPQLQTPPMRFDVRDYQIGRVFAGAWKRGKRSVGATLAVHALGIALLFFVMLHALPNSEPQAVARIEGTSTVAPPLPGGTEMRGDVGGFGRTALPFGPTELTRLPYEAEASGLGESAPSEARRDTEPEMRQPPREETLGAVAPLLRSESSAWFRLRSASRREKIAYLGSEELYAALERSLAWLQRVQQPQGSWGHVGAMFPPANPDLDLVQRLEMTSAALLAFLGDGHSSKASLVGYDYNVKRGVDWLLQQQQPDGRIGPAGVEVVLGHAMATLVLAEDFALSRDFRLREPLCLAARWLSSVRPVGGGGGFPYRLDREASLTSSVWAHMALVTARKLNVPQSDAPQARIDDLLTWFEKETRGFTVLRDSDEVLAKSDLLPTAGAASLSQFAVDAGYEMRRATFLARLGKDQPNLDPAAKVGDAGDVRYLFFGSLAHALEHQRSGTTSTWHGAFAQTVLAQQIKQGGNEGAFEPSGDYASLYGRVFSTAMTALSVENAYRVQLLK